MAKRTRVDLYEIPPHARQLVGCTRYFITPEGRLYLDGEVRGLHRMFELKLSIGRWGYLQHSLLHSDGKRRSRQLHRLLAEMFIPNPNRLKYVNHKDGDKLNNSLENLEWCTASHNTKEAWRLGLCHSSPAHMAAFEENRKKCRTWRSARKHQ